MSHPSPPMANVVRPTAAQLAPAAGMVTAARALAGADLRTVTAVRRALAVSATKVARQPMVAAVLASTAPSAVPGIKAHAAHPVDGAAALTLTAVTAAKAAAMAALIFRLILARVTLAIPEVEAAAVTVTMRRRRTMMTTTLKAQIFADRTRRTGTRKLGTIWGLLNGSKIA